MFEGLSTEGLEEAEDRLGGFTLYDTDIYLANLKAVYGIKADSGARGVVVIATLPGNKEYRETFYVTTKTGVNYFLNKADTSKKVALPGFQIVEDLCIAVTGKSLKDIATDDKVMNVYDAEQRKEIPKSVPALVELMGKDIYLGIEKKLVNKQVQNTSTKEWEDSTDSREENGISKIFHHPTKLTVAEAKAGKTAPEFFDKWQEKNKGTVRDARKIKDGGGTKGAPQGGSASGKPASTPSLFGNKA
jgi:hypothetical protein